VTKPNTRLCACLVLIVGFTYFSWGSVAQDAARDTLQAGALIGVWGSENAFGPTVRGELTIDTRRAEWRARIAGFDVPIRREKDAITFSLPGDAGEFRGHMSASGEAITGDWIRPAGTVNSDRINSSMVNMARLLGPSLAGAVIALSSEGYCFLIDGISYLAVIASLVAMRLRPGTVKHAADSMLVQLKEGWAYVSGFAPVRTILLLFALVSLMGWPFTVLMPIFAGKILKGGPHTLGFLMGAMGIGALVSALSLAARKTVLGLGRMIPISTAALGAGLILFGMSRILWVSLILMLVCGFGMMQQMAASNTIIQTIVEESKRGRVMSFYTVAFVGMAPFGSLLAGGLAQAFGAPFAVMLSGGCCLAAAAWFATQLQLIRKLIRPIYRDLGILPPVNVVIQESAGQ
jgi:MFS family permease